MRQIARHPRRIGALTLTSGLALAMLTTLPVSVANAEPMVATITVDPDNPGRTIPADFLGLSFEANLMHEQWISPDHGNVAQLLRNLGRGNMRFGANQVDRTAWLPDPGAPVPDWVEDGQHVTPADLTRVGDLARAIGWSVDMGVDLGHFDPAAAADQARSAQERIGDSLRSLQIGNEPNIYKAAPLLGGGERRPYDPDTYAVDARIYREAMRSAAPGVRIEGPNTMGATIGVAPVDEAIMASAVRPWLQGYLANFGAESRTLNQHYYPFVNIGKAGVPDDLTTIAEALPTVDGLLAAETSDRQTAFIRELVDTAHGAGLKPVLGETNAVAMEGRAGVTDTFANALWTADYLMTAAREGIVGVNLHMQPNMCESYTLFCFEDDAARESGTARPNPNYYAALAFNELVGGQILPTTVEAGGARISALAVRLPDAQIKVLVDNLDRDFTGDVAVRIAGRDDGHTATMRMLTADTPESLSGATFGGAAVAADGSISPAAEALVAQPDGYRVAIDRPSAALVTIS